MTSKVCRVVKRCLGDMRQAIGRCTLLRACKITAIKVKQAMCGGLASWRVGERERRGLVYYRFRERSPRRWSHGQRSDG